jgi:hypothetical protein
MVRQMAAVSIAAASIIASSVGAKAAYRIERVVWGNDDVRNDRMYVRDASGKRIVLSRHWGGGCNRRAALSYGLGGGCWYPVRESYPAWRKKP